jgi:hypothetical protein
MIVSYIYRKLSFNKFVYYNHNRVKPFNFEKILNKINYYILILILCESLLMIINEIQSRGKKIVT